MPLPILPSDLAAPAGESLRSLARLATAEGLADPFLRLESLGERPPDPLRSGFETVTYRFHGGGRLRGYRLWVRLPRGDEATVGRELPADRPPVVLSPDGGTLAAVLAGEAFGAKGAVETRTPILFLQLTLQPGARLFLPVPEEHTLFAHVLDGRVQTGPAWDEIGEGQLGAFRKDGAAVGFAIPGRNDPAELLLFGGAFH